MTMAKHGISDDIIAAAYGISEASLKNHMQGVLSKGRAKGIGEVAATFFQMATSGICPAATIFFMKCRAKWKEADSNDAAPTNQKEPKSLAIG